MHTVSYTVDQKYCGVDIFLSEQYAVELTRRLPLFYSENTILTALP